MTARGPGSAQDRLATDEPYALRRCGEQVAAASRACLVLSGHRCSSGCTPRRATRRDSGHRPPCCSCMGERRGLRGLRVRRLATSPPIGTRTAFLRRDWAIVAGTMIDTDCIVGAGGILRPTCFVALRSVRSSWLRGAACAVAAKPPGIALRRQQHVEPPANGLSRRRALPPMLTLPGRSRSVAIGSWRQTSNGRSQPSDSEAMRVRRRQPASRFGSDRERASRLSRPRERPSARQRHGRPTSPPPPLRCERLVIRAICRPQYPVSEGSGAYCTPGHGIAPLRRIRSLHISPPESQWPYTHFPPAGRCSLRVRARSCIRRSRRAPTSARLRMFRSIGGIAQLMSGGRRRSFGCSAGCGMSGVTLKCSFRIQVVRRRLGSALPRFGFRGC